MAALVNGYDPASKSVSLARRVARGVLVPAAMKKTKKLSLTTTTVRKLTAGDYVRVAGGLDDEPPKSAANCPSAELEPSCASCVTCVTCVENGCTIPSRRVRC